MPFTARVFKILIASPSDVFKERDIIEEVIQRWNNRNSVSEKVILFPARWETQVPATLNVDPQSEVNRRIVDNCDLAVGVFWKRVGTPTDFFESGTIEELTKVGNAQKTIMLYHSKIPVDLDSLDFGQAEKVKQFIQRAKGIILPYNDLFGFERQFSDDLDVHIREIIAKDKKDNPDEKPNNYEPTSVFPKLLAIMEKKVPPLEDSNNQPIKKVFAKIKTMLDYMEKNKGWKAELKKGLELNVFQQALNQTVSSLDKKKFMYNKLSDFLPRIFTTTNFRLYKSDLNNSPKIGLVDVTKLSGYYQIQNTEISPIHSVQGYKNALSFYPIYLPFEGEFEEFAHVIENTEIIAQSKDAIINIINGLGFDDKQSANIFNSLKTLEIIVEQGKNDEDTKLYRLFNINQEELKLKIKEKIEFVIGEVCDSEIFNALFDKNEKNV